MLCHLTLPSNQGCSLAIFLSKTQNVLITLTLELTMYFKLFILKLYYNIITLCPEVVYLTAQYHTDRTENERLEFNSKSVQFTYVHFSYLLLLEKYF